MKLGDWKIAIFISWLILYSFPTMCAEPACQSMDGNSTVWMVWRTNTSEKFIHIFKTTYRWWDFVLSCRFWCKTSRRQFLIFRANFSFCDMYCGLLKWHKTLQQGTVRRRSPKDTIAYGPRDQGIWAIELQVGCPIMMHCADIGCSVWLHMSGHYLSRKYISCKTDGATPHFIIKQQNPRCIGPRQNRG